MPVPPRPIEIARCRPPVPRRLTSHVLAIATAVASLAAVRGVGAQGVGVSRGPGGVTLAPKRSLTLPTVPACVRAGAPPAAARRDEAAARTAAARARELALVGDRDGARVAFTRAAALDPSSPQLAYDLARAAEEAGDAAGAVSAYCQTLALAPSGAAASDARARLARLTGNGGVEAERRARDAFARGLVALDGGQVGVARAAFDEVLQTTPNAPEAAYDRGLAALALGRDAEAARDLAAYVASPAAGADRGDVLRAVDALRRPALNPGTALARGVLPGFGQLYTGRPVAGVAVLAVAAAAVGFAFYQKSDVREERFVDSFGNPYTSPVTVTSHPYAAAGIGAAAVVTAVAAFEASRYAAGTRGRRPTVSVRTAMVPGGRSGGVALALALGGRF